MSAPALNCTDCGQTREELADKGRVCINPDCAKGREHLDRRRAASIEYARGEAASGNWIDSVQAMLDADTLNALACDLVTAPDPAAVVRWLRVRLYEAGRLAGHEAEIGDAVTS